MKETGEHAFDADALVSALTDIRDHAAGKSKLTMRTTTLRLPARTATIRPTEVRRIRLGLNVSQEVFASLLNVPLVTAASWETGRRHPSGAALRLLQVARHRPDALIETTAK
jgi:putative transcriptional regulator